MASIMLTGAVLLLLIAFVPLIELAKLASAFQLIVFSLVNLEPNLEKLAKEQNNMRMTDQQVTVIYKVKKQQTGKIYALKTLITHAGWDDDDDDEDQANMSLAAMEAALKPRVLETLDRSRQLESRWGVPITGADLQAEVDCTTGAPGESVEWARCHDLVVIASSCGPNPGRTSSTPCGAWATS